MGILTSNKYIGSPIASCDGEFAVTLALSAVPSDITANIAVVIQSSASMSGAPLERVKVSAAELINAIEKSGADRARASVISFSDRACELQSLTEDSSLLISAVNGISASGGSALACALTEAHRSLEGAEGLKIIAVFSDGSYTGADPSSAAASITDDGIALYFIAVESSTSDDNCLSRLGSLSSSPSAAYVITAPADGGGTFPYFIADLSENLAVNGAESICVNETVSDNFEIVSAAAPTLGTVTVTGRRTLTWNISQLGLAVPEGAALTFNVRHTGEGSGEKCINASAVYTDCSGNTASFNSPEILIDCGHIDYFEPSASYTETTAADCGEEIAIDAGEITMTGSGRLARVSVTLRGVCPGRRTALAVALSEAAPDGTEHSRGMRTFIVPAHSYPSRRDIRVNSLTFVLPDDNDIPAGCNGERVYRTRIYATSYPV